MWEKLRQHDDSFVSPTLQMPSNIALKWAQAVHRAARPRRFSRFSGLCITSLKLKILLLLLGVMVMIHKWIPTPVPLVLEPTASTEYAALENTTLVPPIELAAFQPPSQTDPGQYRHPDTIDTFAGYKFRKSCNISSLDLHAAFSPLCTSRIEMLDAMSSGGRIGMDGRFMPRGCDMRWFSSDEVCEILGRFDKIILVGDSMLRHIIGSMNVLVRKDLGYGAVTDWNFSMQERKECFCNEQFDVKSCSVQGIYKTADVLANDPQSLSCSNPINVIMEQIVKHPIPTEELSRLQTSLTDSSTISKSNSGMISSSISSFGGSRNRDKRIAIIFGHGLWSNLDLQKTVDWFDQVLETITNAIGNENWYGLYVTPNAAGKEKPDDWIVTQGNKALCLFEEAVGIEVRKRNSRIFENGKGFLEHLGTWNMSIQARTYDGVHLDMKGNLVKAQMVLNWLAMI